MVKKIQIGGENIQTPISPKSPSSIFTLTSPPQLPLKQQQQQQSEMSLLPALKPKPFPPTLSTTNPKHLFSFFFISPSTVKPDHALHLQPLRAISSNPDSTPNNPNPKPKPKPKPRARRSKPKTPQTDETETKSEEKPFMRTIPRKPRRGRRSEATAVEDYIRNTLEQTFESIRNQSSKVSEDMEKVLKEKENDDSDDEDEGDGKKKKRKSKKKKDVVDEEDPNWPLDADVGWGIRASEYFDKHPIKNVVGDDGVEIDWEGEIEDNFVNEIDCLEWERFAYHPSPLIVLVFERYNRATDNWKLLKELEKAIKVYWDAKDRLPPRTVKIDINIERDLAYALKVRECPQLLFLKGNKILYREKGIRTSDELIQMIAHFYYNAKKPSCIDDTALAPPY